MEWSVPLRYFFRRDCLYWSSGEAVLSIGYFMLYSIPVVVPALLYFDQLQTCIREGYIILYLLAVLFLTYAFFWLSNYFFWIKKVKTQVLKEVRT